MPTNTNTNNSIKQMRDAFPIGTVVLNFGNKAVVIGYHELAESLILRGNLCQGSVGNWIADPAKCIKL